MNIGKFCPLPLPLCILFLLSLSCRTGSVTTGSTDSQLFYLNRPTGHTSGRKKNSLNIQCLGGTFLGHQGPRRRDIPDKNFMQVSFFCCFRHGVAGISQDLGRDVPDLENFMQEYFGLTFRTLTQITEFAQAIFRAVRTNCPPSVLYIQLEACRKSSGKLDCHPHTPRLF